MKEKYYLISEKELKRLLYRNLELEELIEAGVDNWQGYGHNYCEKLKELCEEYEIPYNENVDYQTIAEVLLQKFQPFE